MLKHKMLLLAVLLGVSVNVNATPASKNTGKCQFIRGLTMGLNTKTYQECSDKLNACPKNNQLTFSNECVSKTIRQEKSCQQLDKLAKFIRVSPGQITATPKGNMSLIDVYFSADGGHLYYILSPKGCLISTNVDPRDISQSVKKQFAQADFYIDAHGEPTYSTQNNGVQRFTAAIDAKKQCRACPVVATAEINFDFAKNGTWLKTTLGQFESK